MKKGLLLSIVLIFAFPATAQTFEKKRERRLLYYFNGGIGVYLPTTAITSLSETGFVGGFQFQVDYQKHLFGRFFFDQYSIAFHTRYSQNNANTFIKGKVPTTGIGGDIGYRWHVRRFSPYVYGGSGVAITDVPFLETDQNSNDVTLTTTSRSSIVVRGGAGINYTINRFFIIYFESQFMSFPIRTQVYDGALNGLSFQIGFKTPLQ